MNVFYRFVKAEFLYFFSLLHIQHHHHHYHHRIYTETINVLCDKKPFGITRFTFKQSVYYYFFPSLSSFFRGVVLEARQVEKHIYIPSSKCLFIFLLNIYRI